MLARTIAVDATSVTYRFGARIVLRDVALAVRRGEIMLVTGRSGSGKTTLLTLAGGLRRPQSGRIVTLGADLGELGPEALARFRRAVRFIFQRHHLLTSLTALQNVEVGLASVDGNSALIRSRSMAMLNDVGLGERLHARPAELSGGEQQRVALARALVSRPALLIADEPTAHLDREASLAVAGLISRLTEQIGCAVLLATHDDRILHIADRAVRLEDGVAIPIATRPRDPGAEKFAGGENDERGKRIQ